MNRLNSDWCAVAAVTSPHCARKSFCDDNALRGDLRLRLAILFVSFWIMPKFVFSFGFARQPIMLNNTEPG